jgi:hypothetical protein
MRSRAASKHSTRCGAQRSPSGRGLAAAEEHVRLETYVNDLMKNQRGLVYAYTALERLVRQLENMLHDVEVRRLEP